MLMLLSLLLLLLLSSLLLMQQWNDRNQAALRNNNNNNSRISLPGHANAKLQAAAAAIPFTKIQKTQNAIVCEKLWIPNWNQK